MYRSCGGSSDHTSLDRRLGAFAAGVSERREHIRRGTVLAVGGFPVPFDFLVRCRRRLGAISNQRALPVASISRVEALQAIVEVGLQRGERQVIRAVEERVF